MTVCTVFLGLSPSPRLDPAGKSLAQQPGPREAPRSHKTTGPRIHKGSHPPLTSSTCRTAECPIGTPQDSQARSAPDRASPVVPAGPAITSMTSTGPAPAAQAIWEIQVTRAPPRRQLKGPRLDTAAELVQLQLHHTPEACQQCHKAPQPRPEAAGHPLQGPAPGRAD
ncbi:hypothetical protein NDU88_004874 [Pleurodeles waltl]|uniref:Uncharacterized protein n=1 Tax=Pleurodeles waltl TaxID=8319 RepID=A0AAV7NTQ8_PLEWA|nr:hypothetical protein NDU88_004874 [Pleurodeles waltl]